MLEHCLLAPPTVGTGVGRQRVMGYDDHFACRFSLYVTHYFGTHIFHADDEKA
jgi:hypothetical protein